MALRTERDGIVEGVCTAVCLRNDVMHFDVAACITMADAAEPPGPNERFFADFSGERHNDKISRDSVEELSPMPGFPLLCLPGSEARSRGLTPPVNCRDDSGKGYLIGQMYLLLGDISGAVRSFEWFEKEFSDDSGEPFHLLCWALALYKSNDTGKAAKKLRRAMLSNLYLVPYLVGIEQPALDIWQSTNWEGKEYVEQGPAELLQLWDEQALLWAKELYQSKSFRNARERTIEIFRLLKTEPVGPKRSELVNELSALRYSD